MPDKYSESALRHLVDADHLASVGRLDGAGYLIGIAVECAIKCAIVADQPDVVIERVHLPRLVETAKKALKGRLQHAMIAILDQTSFLDGWTIDLRYAGDGAVAGDQYGRWRKDADRALTAANLRRKML